MPLAVSSATPVLLRDVAKVTIEEGPPICAARTRAFRAGSMSTCADATCARSSMTCRLRLPSPWRFLFGSGTGSEVMSRIAASMVGGMVTAPLLSMLVIPAAWFLVHRRRTAALTATPAADAAG